MAWPSGSRCPAAAIELGCAVSVPDQPEPARGSLAEPLHTVLNGQAQAQIAAGDSVLVVGLGPIGTLHVAVARSRGAGPVLGVDRLPDRVQAAAAVLGPDAVREPPEPRSILHDRLLVGGGRC